ncbi:MAG: hypothetical protein C4K60_00300 [Ideonella sp. MAG2]|nr:MAG: hypothetical protein C4K60_00300 [Ideonella sp. MAG2]
MTPSPDAALRFEPIVSIDEALARPRVLALLRSAAPVGARLTLLTAPAGFGKTTALAQLAAAARQEGQQVAWLNCDDRDKNLQLFTENLQAALARCALVLESPGGLGLAGLQTPLLICVDGYEQASSEAVDEFIEALAWAAPPLAHVVLTSRSGPRPHLTRLQLAGKVRLLDAELLRFTPEESAHLLAQALPASAAAQVTAYAQGWPFALQLVRLRASSGAMSADWALDPRSNMPRRQIFDYLAAEVLTSLPQELLDFLREVAVLDSIDVASANALRGREDSLSFIRQLARIRPIAVVDEAPWVARLHPLLRDYLMELAELSKPGCLAHQHQLAARYWGQHGRLHEAVSHAVAGGHLALGADLVEQAGGFALLANEGAVRSRLILQQLPEALIRQRPRLRLLQLMQQVLESDSISTGPAFERLEQEILQADSGPDDRARFDLDFVRCLMLVQASEHQLEFSPWSALDHARQLGRAHAAQDQRPLACALSVEIYFLHRYGPAERCERRVQEIESLFAGGAYTHNSPWIWTYRARNAMARGALQQAESILHEQLERDANFLNFRQGSLQRLVSSLLGRIAYERAELDAALEHFLAVAPDALNQQLEALHSSHIDAARCEFALGACHRAIEMLQSSRHFAFEEGLVHLEILAGACQVELLNRLGEVERAAQLAQSIKLATLWDQALTPFALPWVVVEALARARYWDLLHSPDAALAATLATQFLGLSHTVGQPLSVLSAHLMAALALSQQGQMATARSHLQQAAQIGAATGAVQRCLDGGSGMMALLREANFGEPTPEGAWAALVLQAWMAAFHTRAERTEAKLLTPRELDVLCELAKDHSTKLMAKNLQLSPETVKHHLKSIFSKLMVKTREDAIREARKRGLLP